MRTVIKNGKKFNVNETLYKRMSKLNILKEGEEEYNLFDEPENLKKESEYKILLNNIKKIIKGLQLLIKKYMVSINFAKYSSEIPENIKEKLKENLSKTLKILSKSENIGRIYERIKTHSEYELKNDIEAVIKTEIWKFVIETFNNTNNLEKPLEQLKLDFFSSEFDNKISGIDKMMFTDTKIANGKKEVYTLKFLKMIVNLINAFDPRYIDMENIWVKRYVFILYLQVNCFRKINKISDEKNIRLTEEQIKDIIELDPVLSNLVINKHDFCIIDKKDYTNEIKEENEKIIKKALRILLYADGGIKNYFIAHKSEMINELMRVGGLDDYDMKEKYLYDKWGKEIMPSVLPFFKKHISNENLETIKLPYYTDIPTIGFFENEKTAKRWWELFQINHAGGI